MKSYPLYERVSDRVSAIQAVGIMGNPKAKLQLADGTMINYLPARKLVACQQRKCVGGRYCTGKRGTFDS